MTPDKFILNENTRDKIRNIIKNFKNITDKEFDCLYINKDGPFKICDLIQNISENEQTRLSNNITETLNKIMMA